VVTEKQIIEALGGVMDPELRKSITELGMVRNVKVEGSGIELTLALTTMACPLSDVMVKDIQSVVGKMEGVSSVRVHLEEMTDEERARIFAIAQQAHPQPEGVAAHLNHVKHVLAIMSGKGGVGKSLVTALLATTLRRKGLRVGVLDADITGPSIPKIFGVSDRPISTPLGIAPVKTKTGILVMSINLLLPNEDDAVIWRGPLIGGAIKQFWGDVFWGNLDYLLVDLPPGTADAPLTVMQSLPLNGIVLVTSPQELAGMVVRKAAQMAQQMNIPMLGIVENMSYATCPHCGERINIFGPSHTAEAAALMAVPMLGQIPIDVRIATLSDGGDIESYTAEGFDEVVEELLKLVPESATKPTF
jgi:Mrp family chromosome partitioning ATPase